MGGGSIPLAVACLGGLLSYLGLSALNSMSELPHMLRGKEEPMIKTGNSMRRKPLSGFGRIFVKSMISTLWAVGTGIASGLALSG